MQVGIPVAYNVFEVKLDKITDWIFSCDGILKHKLKLGFVIGSAKTLNEAIYIAIIIRQIRMLQALRPNRRTSG